MTMGSWTELDANYPEGALTPATGFVVALGHLAGARSVYADGGAGGLPDFVPSPERGLVADRDLLTRAERYLREVPLDDFLSEARAVLNPQQMRCLLLNLLDAVLAHGRPDDDPRYRQIVFGLGAVPEQIRLDATTLVYQNDLSIFPQ
jgi:hypothetical protein